MPTLEPIVLAVQSKGITATSKDVKDLAGDIEQLGETAEKAGKTFRDAAGRLREVGSGRYLKEAKDDLVGLDEQTRTLVTDLRKASQAFEDVGKKATGGKYIFAAQGGLKDVQKQTADMRALGVAMQDLRAGGSGGNDLAATLERGSQATGKLIETAGAVRDVGAALTVAGAGGTMLSNKMIEVSEQGRGIEQRLESILKQQGRLGDLDALNNNVQDVTVRGHFNDDDELREATVRLLSFNTATKDTGNLLELAARQARTMRGEAGSAADVAEQLGKAYNSGKVSNLVKSGVTLDPADINKITDAYARSAAEGQALYVQLIGAAIEKNSVSLEDSLTSTQAAANDAARSLDDFSTNAGGGAAYVRSEFQGVGASILGVANEAPGLEAVGGGLFTIGSYAVTAGGSLLTLGSQVAQIVLAWKAFQTAKELQAASQLEAAAAAGVEAESQVAAGAASAVAGDEAAAGAIGFDALAKAEEEATIAADAEAISATAAGTASAAAGTAAATGGAAAGAAATGGWAVFLTVLGSITAALVSIPALAGAAFVAVVGGFQLWWRYRGEGKTLHDNIDAGNSMDANEQDMSGHSRLESVNAGRAALGQRAMTQDEFKAFYTDEDTQDDTQKALVAKLAQDDAAAKLQRKLNGGKPVASSATVQTPGQAAAPTANGAPAAYSAPGAPDAAPSSSSSIEDTNPYTSQIDSLQAQIRAAKGKSNANRRAQLQDQLVAVRHQAGDWNRQHSAAVRAGKESERAATKAERESDRHAKLEASLRETETDEDFETRIAAKEAERDQAKEDTNDARANALDLEIAQLNAQKEHADALARIAGMDDDDQFAKDIEKKRADRKYQGALQRAQIKSDAKGAGKAGSLSEATLLARLRAGLAAGQGNFGAPSGEGSVFNPYANDHTFSGYSTPFVSHAAGQSTPLDTTAFGVPSRPARGSSGPQRVRVQPRAYFDTNKQKVIVEFDKAEVEVSSSDDDLEMRPLR